MTDLTKAAPVQSEYVLEARNLTKSFGSVQALKDGSIRIVRGEVTAVVGDNGAGKSTLVRALSGVHIPDGGELIVNGEPARFSSPEDARNAGIETVHQNLALVEDLTVWQNLFLSREITKNLGIIKVLDRKAMRIKAQEMVSSLAVNVPAVTSRVRRLSGGQRQAVAIVRAAGWGKNLVIMDEPTAALGVQETARVEELVRDLRNDGVTVLIISHNFDQVLRLSDSVCVMRSGRAVAQKRTSELDGEKIVGLVTGAIQG